MSCNRAVHAVIVEDIPEPGGTSKHAGFYNLRLLASASRRKPYHLMKVMRSARKRRSVTFKQPANGPAPQKMSEQDTVHSLLLPPLPSAPDGTTTDRRESRLQQVQRSSSFDIDVDPHRVPDAFVQLFVNTSGHEGTRHSEDYAQWIRRGNLNQTHHAMLMYRRVHREKANPIWGEPIWGRPEKLIIMITVCCLVLVGVFIMAHILWM